MIDPAKAYARGTGNAVPNIPDPVARHADTGLVKVSVKAEQRSGNVVIGQPPASAQAQPEQAPPSAAAPMLRETEEYFNDAIVAALRRGDVDRALSLLNEAERLGSPTARETFIRGVKKP